MYRPWLFVASWLSLFATASSQQIAPPNSSALPPPVVALPKTPVDDSGVFRLHLDQALGAAPLTVVLHVESGTVRRAAALPNRNVQAWSAVDASRLVVKAGRMTGAISVTFSSVFEPALHRRHTFEGRPNPKAERYELKPELSATYELNVKYDGTGGEGQFTAMWSGEKNVRALGYALRREEKGNVSVLREASRPLSDTWQANLFLHGGLADVTFGELVPWRPFVFLRVASRPNEVRSVAHAVVQRPSAQLDSVDRLEFREQRFSLRDGQMAARYAAQVKDIPKSEFTLELNGQAIGRRLVGTATIQRGEYSATTQWIGTLHDCTAWPLPLELAPTTWDWQHDLAADAKFAAQASEESLRPVMPGEPGKFGFWTWRKLTPSRQVSVVHPPSFDLQETVGAASYRFTIVNKDKSVRREFTTDKPWRPLVPVWKQLPPDSYSLVVVGLDTAGKELAAPMRMGILDKATAQPTTTELTSISFIKRPPFAGPYANPDRAWLETALAMSRWHRAHPGLYERHGIGISPSGNVWTTGGDHGYGVTVADRVWSILASRALTNDLSERLFAEEMLAFNREDLETHQRANQPEGYIYDYQADTPLAYWSGSAILDAYLATGDERWKQIALKLGRAILGQQKENGAFYSPRHDIRDPKTRRGPHGFFTWREGAIEFGAAELLYLFGRLRRDLKTDEFIAAEAKAYQWVMKNGVKERFWPINVSHSINSGYPIWQHPVAALCFSRYLLECAPPERRDVKLAEDVARWAEDVGVEWTRAAEEKQTSPITPRISSIDRYNNDPIAVNLLAAVVFEELSQAIGDKLWSAKGRALAVASLQGTDPATGRPASNLIPNSENHCSIARGYGDPAHLRHWDFCNGWATQLFREYAALVNEK